MLDVSVIIIIIIITAEFVRRGESIQRLLCLLVIWPQRDYLTVPVLGLIPIANLIFPYLSDLQEQLLALFIIGCGIQLTLQQIHQIIPFSSVFIVTEQRFICAVILRIQLNNLPIMLSGFIFLVESLRENPCASAVIHHRRTHFECLIQYIAIMLHQIFPQIQFASHLLQLINGVLIPGRQLLCFLQHLKCLTGLIQLFRIQSGYGEGKLHLSVGIPVEDISELAIHRYQSVPINALLRLHQPFFHVSNEVPHPPDVLFIKRCHHQRIRCTLQCPISVVHIFKEHSCGFHQQFYLPRLIRFSVRTNLVDRYHVVKAQ